MAYGFVYVLGNHLMPGVYKVGYTDRSPRQRCEEISRATGVPFDFQVICYAEYENPRDREQWIHRELAKYRTSPDHEFFKCDLLLITDLVMHEEDCTSLSEHQMLPYLYSDSKLYRQRLFQLELAKLPEPF